MLFYADDLCQIAFSAITLQELITIANALNFNATKPYCRIFTPKKCKLLKPLLYLNMLSVLYTDSIKYLDLTISSHNCDDNDMLKQMVMLYCRTSRLVTLFIKCIKPVLLELCRSFLICTDSVVVGCSLVMLAIWARFSHLPTNHKNYIF